LEKGKEPVTKDADEELFFDDTKFAVELLRSTFRKLEDVGAAFDIKVHHDVYLDPSVNGFAFRIHGLAEKLENLPVVNQAAAASWSSMTAALTVMTVATVTTARLRLIDRLLYQLVTMCVRFCVFVRFLDMNCLVCLSIMNYLVN
jgi:hypothetical protein